MTFHSAILLGPGLIASSKLNTGLSFLFIQARPRVDVACEVNNMSTRGCIARLQRREPLEFKGVYHHWDSYPSGLGQTLFQLRNTDFARDTNAMTRTLIDEHPAGWSTVVGTTFSKTPGFREGAGVKAETDDAPRCYCHGDRSETGWPVTHGNAAASGVEFAYVFDGATMLVLGSYYADGAKMVGMFGCGDEDAVWRVIAEIDLDGPEPDWEALDGAPPMPNDGKWVSWPTTAGESAHPVSIHEDRLCKKTRSAR